MLITGIVLEKWSERPIPLANVWIGGNEFETDEEGRFSVDVPLGNILIRVNKEGYEEGVVSLQVIGEAQYSITLKPILEAL